MKQHTTDLVALLFGLAFAISGVLVLVTQSTSVDISPEWAAAVGLIVLGVVALAATFARTIGAPAAAIERDDAVEPVSPWERSD